MFRRRMSICCDTIISILLVLLSGHLCNGQTRDVKIHNCTQSEELCVLHSECPNSRSLITSNQAKLCGFQDEVNENGSKICCNSTNIAKTKNSTAVALQKCQEYGKYRYVQKWRPSELPDGKGYYYNMQDCVSVLRLIVEGTPAEAKEYPHMALIGFGTEFNNVTWNCGGSLISENFVLSAAHCVNTSAGPPQWVLLGDLNISTTAEDSKPKVYSIVKVYNHPEYNSKSLYYDISLFQLNTTVEFSPYVRPACLYTSTDDLPINAKASITGWGKTGAIERTSNRLLKATIGIVNDENCKTSFEANPVRFAHGYDSNSMICAGDIEKGRDTCPGDSGGPLQILIPEQVCMWNIIGVTSFGPSICGNNEDPGVYTKVSYYLDWIQSIVWPQTWILACVKLSDCSNARALISNKTALPYGYRDEVLKKDVKICCNSSVPSKNSSTSQISELCTTSATPKHTPNSKNSTAVAQQKCQEYAQFRFVTEWKEPALPGEEGRNYTSIDCVDMTNTLIIAINNLPALAKEYPHVALIGYGEEFNNVSWDCDGTLISEKYIMSAAHCSFISTLGRPRWVLLGDVTTSSRKSNSKSKVYSIVKVYNHPNFKLASFNHDISLFELNTTVEFSPYVRPACLYTSKADLPIGNKARITGWERIDTGEQTNSELVKSTVSVIDHQKCRTAFEVGKATKYDSNTMICAENTYFDRDSCKDISAGQIQIHRSNQPCMWDIIGITSFRPGICGNHDNPGIHTKVSYYLDWIQNIVWP